MNKAVVDFGAILDGMLDSPVDPVIHTPDKLTDEQIDRLGTFFVAFQIQGRYGLTFERFVQKVQNGTWEAWLA